MILQSSSPSSARIKKGFKMFKNKKFALIGKTLKHSYSKLIHKELGDYPYDLIEVKEEDLKDFALSKRFDGYNVTIPYKTDIIPYLDQLDGVAKEIGAVNTVVNANGKLIGYNTDFYGMQYMLASAGINLKDKIVMILGTGGTSKTATVVAKSLGAKQIVTVSRSGEINYQNCYDVNDVEVIINTTPVGMYPNNYEKPLDIKRFKNLEGVADVVYNPSLTLICNDAKEQGIKYVNGLKMLVAQAKFAYDKFFNTVADNDIIDKIYDKLSKENQNIVLVGMPGSGKSTVGREVAKRLNREFIDTDEEIVKRTGVDIPTLFKEKGEPYFRALESEVIKDVCKSVGKVISTGGGAVKDILNRYPMRSNGKIFCINRSIELLASDGRPLSKSKEDIEKLYEERKDKYLAFADVLIDNNGEIENAVKGVINSL